MLITTPRHEKRLVKGAQICKNECLRLAIPLTYRTEYLGLLDKSDQMVLITREQQEIAYQRRRAADSGNIRASSGSKRCMALMYEEG